MEFVSTADSGLNFSQSIIVLFLKLCKYNRKYVRQGFAEKEIRIELNKYFVALILQLLRLALELIIVEDDFQQRENYRNDFS